jgi:hypothetical protein
MRQRPFVFKDLAEITAIHPAAASGAFDEVFGLVFWWRSNAFADVLPAPDLGYSNGSRLQLERGLRGMVAGLLTRRDNNARYVVACRALVCDEARLA